MNVIFGPGLDGPSHPAVLGDREACHGELCVGPLGLLGLLETHCGTGTTETSEPVRIAEYRTRLEHADDGDRFYSRSFEADPFGVARTLYHWREELLFGGWAGTATSSAPARLQDLAAIEAVDTTLRLDPGPAERLQLLLATLAARRPPIAALGLTEDPQDLPCLWRRLLEALAGWNVPLHRRSAPQGNATGDLGHLQRVLAGTAVPSPAVGDGSLVLLTARSDLEAAEAVASWLTRGHDDTIIVDVTADPLLNDAARSRGLRSTGICAASRFRPALQVLPLALALQWDPVDPNRVLELLTLPVGPVPRSAALTLARAIAGSPGVGGSAWTAALDHIRTRIQQDGDTASAGAAQREIAALEQAVRDWVQPARFRMDDGIPPQVVAATCGRVAQWLAGRLAAVGEDIVLRAALGAAREARRLAEAETQPRLAPTSVRRLLDAATQSGARHPDAIAEAEHVACLKDPAAIFAPVPVVVWWDFTGASDASPPPLPWSAGERAGLAREGIDLTNPADDRLRRTQREWRPLVAATTRVVLVAPDRRRGQVATRHPLWDRIASAFGARTDALEIRVQDWLAHGRANGMGLLPSVHVPRRALPRPKRWWRLPSGAHLSPRDRESFTSLNRFVNHPFLWVLEYKAALRPGFTARLADDNLLLGSLGHRLIAEAASDPSLVGAGVDAIRDVLAARMDAVLETEGSALLLPDRSADRRKLLDRSARGAHILLETARRGGWTILGFEHPLTSAFADGELDGRLDVALEGPDGLRAVIDIKWGSRRYRVQELKENTALQLALYGHLLSRDGTPWPTGAYLVLDPPSLLSVDGDAFPGALHVPTTAGTPADLWTTVESTWRWRRAQLDRGWIEMTAGTRADDDSSPPVGCRLTEVECRFNDYASLTGFPLEEQP
jgi:hypothetical protein